MGEAWTVSELRTLDRLKAAGADLTAMAWATGRTRGDCDLALWSLLNRTPEEAAAAQPPPRQASAVRRTGVRRFIDHMFGGSHD